jgi:hypothetical protein
MQRCSSDTGVLVPASALADSGRVTGPAVRTLQVFRARVGSLRKALKSRADLVFVDGPHAVTAVDSGLAAEAGGADTHQCAWWSWQARVTASTLLGQVHMRSVYIVMDSATSSSACDGPAWATVPPPLAPSTSPQLLY